MKKHSITHFFDINPAASNNIAAGFALGQKWFNNLTGGYFFQKASGVWIELGLIAGIKAGAVATKPLGIDLNTGDLTTDLSMIKPSYKITLPNVGNPSSVPARCLASTIADYPAGWAIGPWGSNPNDLEISHNLGRDILYVSVFSIVGVSKRLLYANAAFSGIIAKDNTNLRIEGLGTIPANIQINLIFGE